MRLRNEWRGACLTPKRKPARALRQVGRAGHSKLESSSAQPLHASAAVSASSGDDVSLGRVGGGTRDGEVHLVQLRPGKGLPPTRACCRTRPTEGAEFRPLHVSELTKTRNLASRGSPQIGAFNRFQSLQDDDLVPGSVPNHSNAIQSAAYRLVLRYNTRVAEGGNQQLKISCPSEFETAPELRKDTVGSVSLVSGIP
jgi:hypothetical protein